MCFVVVVVIASDLKVIKRNSIFILSSLYIVMCLMFVSVFVFVRVCACLVLYLLNVNRPTACVYCYFIWLAVHGLILHLRMHPHSYLSFGLNMQVSLLIFVYLQDLFTLTKISEQNACVCLHQTNCTIESLSLQDYSERWTFTTCITDFQLFSFFYTLSNFFPWTTKLSPKKKYSKLI